MPITPIHLIIDFIFYLFLVKIKVIKAGDYSPLWLMLASNIIDLDHLFRLFQGESPFKKEYGLDNLAFHGWWNVLPISIISMTRYSWFALGWALHLFVDGIMVLYMTS